MNTTLLIVILGVLICSEDDHVHKCRIYLSKTDITLLRTVLRAPKRRKQLVDRPTQGCSTDGVARIRRER